MNTNFFPVGFENFSNQQILDYVTPRINTSTNRVVGIYGQASASQNLGFLERA